MIYFISTTLHTDKTVYIFYNDADTWLFKIYFLLNKDYWVILSIIVLSAGLQKP